MKKLISQIFFIVILNCMCQALAKPPQIPPAIVEAVKVKPVFHQEQIAATGSLVAIPGIIVKPEISGRITKIYFKSGDDVLAGAPLIEINTDVINAQLGEAQAMLKLARLQFRRYSELYKTHDISKAEFDKAQAEHNSLQAKAEQIQAQLRQAKIVAPFAGKLGLSQVSVGDYVNAGQSIVNLQNLDPLKVDFSIPEVYLSKVSVEQTISLHTDAYPKETFLGKVEAIESLINQNNRTLNIRASIPNKDKKLLPGMFVATTLQFGEKYQLIKIPQPAVVYSAEGNYVFKVVNGKAQKTAVELGERDSDDIIIKSGIKPNDVIVTTGQLKVHDGAPVIIAKDKSKN
jgi:membrane fusion protein, multidrug efflux system